MRIQDAIAGMEFSTGVDDDDLVADAMPNRERP